MSAGALATWNSGGQGGNRSASLCYEQRDGEHALLLKLGSGEPLTSRQSTYPVSGKIVSTNTSVMSIDGSVLVGKPVAKGTYMNLETLDLTMECYTEEASPTPPTWTCVPGHGSEGFKLAVQKFDLVKGTSNRCDTFVTPTIPETSHPPVPDTTYATCTVCTNLACLLAPTSGQCANNDDVCTTAVKDEARGREITRACTNETDALNSVASNSPDCAKIETQVLSQGVTCSYACDGETHPNCNKPPQLLPKPETLLHPAPLMAVGPSGRSSVGAGMLDGGPPCRASFLGPTDSLR